MRTGDFSYKVPLDPGIYELRLYFADPSYSPGDSMDGGEGTRVFSVAVNGAWVLRDFDIIADSGPNTADMRVFKDVRPEDDGYLHIDFQKSVGAPLLNAIEVTPGIPHRLMPIRIVTQEEPYTDGSGVVWEPDDYFLAGRVRSRNGAVTGAVDSNLYRRERYGSFSYAIPVAQGRYQVTLYFAETYWGPANPGGGGIGSRVFDVYCNGIALLRNLDIFKEVGGRNALTRTFYGLEPNAQGKLLLSFVPVRNYASLSAIEVTDDSNPSK
jgi:hypothetical protein